MRRLTPKQVWAIRTYLYIGFSQVPESVSKQTDSSTPSFLLQRLRASPAFNQKLMARKSINSFFYFSEKRLLPVNADFDFKAIDNLIQLHR